MIIGEAVTDEMTNELVAKNAGACPRHSVSGRSLYLVEEGGHMVILVTNWHKSSGLPHVPHQQNLPTARRKYAAHAARRLRGELFHDRTAPS